MWFGGALNYLSLIYFILLLSIYGSPMSSQFCDIPLTLLPPFSPTFINNVMKVRHVPQWPKFLTDVLWLHHHQHPAYLLHWGQEACLLCLLCPPVAGHPALLHSVPYLYPAHSVIYWAPGQSHNHSVYHCDPIFQPPHLQFQKWWIQDIPHKTVFPL